MGQTFDEVDFECLIGKEWSLIGKRLRHETDGLWLKDPSAIDAAQWVDDAGKTHELWVHPTSTPTKPVLPFPFTLAQFKTFCGWHPTFEWEAITSVFTNDDDTVDTENLAFVDSRSRAAGALVRFIVGKTDDDFSRAWDQHCAVDDVEAKMVELAALKPDKISEIQYRDARLAELRDELAMLKQGIAGTPSAQSPATPAPVETVETVETVAVATVDQAKPKRSVKRRSWRDVSETYLENTYKELQCPPVKDFYRALLNKAEVKTGSPFDKGTGQNHGSLFARDVYEKVTFKMIEGFVTELRKKM